MCGITGYVSFSKKPQKKILNKMLSTIEHRGPDHKGTYMDENAALGIQRLSIIDLKTGNQPVFNEDKSMLIVFNGEIYDYKKLREDLEKKGHKFKTKSDTETIIHAYEDYDLKTTEHLNGMFAFAIWNKKTKKLFLARDASGIKPLYYFYKNKTLIFGSELKTIRANPIVKTEINTNMLDLYVNLGYIPGPYSMFKNIFKLNPGEILAFSKNGFKTKKVKPKLQNIYGENLDALLQNSVSIQAIADVPVGIFLSGGIDSSLITHYLTTHGHKKIKTFSIGFEDSSFDESTQAHTVAKLLKTRHYHETFKSTDVLELLPKIINKLDEPLADPSLFPTYKVSKLARKHVKVALSGDGGDELFGGYPTYQGHLFAPVLEKLHPSLINAFTSVINLLPKSDKNYPVGETLKLFLEGFKHPTIKRHLAWMSPGFLKRTPRLNKVKNTTKNFISNISKQIKRQSKNKLLWPQMLDYQTYLRDNLLVKVDRASMMNSLEVRVPFLDPRLVEYGFKERRKHIDLFTTKKLLRNISKNKLPDELVNRKKKGFGIPISAWIRGDLKDFVGKSLNNPILYSYVNKNDIQNLLNAHLNKKQNNAKVIWSLVMLSEWLNVWTEKPKRKAIRQKAKK